MSAQQSLHQRKWFFAFFERARVFQEMPSLILQMIKRTYMDICVCKPAGENIAQFWDSLTVKIICFLS